MQTLFPTLPVSFTCFQLLRLAFAPGVSLPSQETAAQLLHSTPLASAASQTAEEAGIPGRCLTVRLAMMLCSVQSMSLTVIVLQVQSEFTNLYEDFLRFSKLMPQFKGLDVMIARVKLLAIFLVHEIESESTRSEFFLPRQGVWQ